MDTSNYYTMDFDLGNNKIVGVGFDLNGLDVTIRDAGEIIEERGDSRLISWYVGSELETFLRKYGTKIVGTIQKEAYLRGF